jgi:hypothetical protein
MPLQRPHYCGHSRVPCFAGAGQWPHCGPQRRAPSHICYLLKKCACWRCWLCQGLHGPGLLKSLRSSPQCPPPPPPARRPGSTYLGLFAVQAATRVLSCPCVWVFVWATWYLCTSPQLGGSGAGLLWSELNAAPRRCAPWPPSQLPSQPGMSGARTTPLCAPRTFAPH